LLLLLVAAALVSIVVGQHADAGIILGIIGLSVGLGFANEFRSERAVEALHDRIRHTALTVRDGRAVAVDVTELVPGDLVRLGMGDVAGAPSSEVLRLGLLCNEAVVEGGRVVAGNPLDQALWEAALDPGGPLGVAAGGAGRGRGDGAGVLGGARRLAVAPFDYDRRLASVLVAEPDGRRRMITKGAPEAVLAHCSKLPAGASAQLDRLFAKGARAIAVATGDGAGMGTVTPAQERGLELAGFLSFSDPPTTGAAASLARLRSLGIEVKVLTGDNDRVAVKVCNDLDIVVQGTLTGAEVEAMDDAALAAKVPATTVFARVAPEQKSRIIKAARAAGNAAFLGDGVNDAVALHDADVGISVQDATDVAKDAADVVLLQKDLGVLADGVVEGRRIFANTIKYVLMGTSSNFGNMFSAAGASLLLGFLPMLPIQILLNNLLYDVGEMTIPTDRVDPELLERPSRWDTAFIRRFMAFFGPISSLFDFATFGVLLWVLDAGPVEFRSGWFVESLATQTLVIFVIRTRRTPSWRSSPSRPLLLTTLACATVGVLLPFSPLAGLFGFTALPPVFLGILAGMVAVYLALAELGKAWFYRPRTRTAPIARQRPGRLRRIERRAARWSHRSPPKHPPAAPRYGS